MPKKLIYSMENGAISYSHKKDDSIIIEKYSGTATRLSVPDEIDNEPVTEIGRKAFLSCKTLKEIDIPDTVTQVGDWAFAHAEGLRSIAFSAGLAIRGKELFLGCKRLREVSFGISEKARFGELGIWRMLAMGVTVLHDYFLFEPSYVGTPDWIKRWDDNLIKLIRLDDLDGFEELWTCGEEDYEGKDYDIKSYPVEKRKLKLRIVYFRLLHPYGISDEAERELKQYLKSHTKGTDTPEAWDIIIEEHRDELEYYILFAEAGCINEENFDALLDDLKNANAEIKAYMLRYKSEKLEQKDAFAAFELDW